MSTALEKVLIGESCGTLVVFFTTQEPQDVTNAIFLLGAFLCARLGATPEQAWEPFEDLGRGLALRGLGRDCAWKGVKSRLTREALASVLALLRHSLRDAAHALLRQRSKACIDVAWTLRS